MCASEIVNKVWNYAHVLRGNDIVDSVVRLCAMNLYLHGIGPSDSTAECSITANDALAKEVGDDRVDMALEEFRSAEIALAENGVAE